MSSFTYNGLYPGIAHETIEVNEVSTSGPLSSSRSMRIWKIHSMEEFNDWMNNNTFYMRYKNDLQPKSIASSIAGADVEAEVGVEVEAGAEAEVESQSNNNDISGSGGGGGGVGRKLMLNPN